VIYAKWKSGQSLASLAEEYERAPQVIGRIVAERHPDLEDDTDRALHRGRLEGLYEEVQSLIENPGWKLAPNGRLAEDGDGKPLYDTGAKIEALKLKLLVLESARKLDARDRPQKRNLTIDIPEAQRQMQEHLTELRAQKAADDAKREAELRRLEELRGKVIRGEIEG
jgi:hypothetical protein